jgi:hypothetical protein
MMLFFAAVLLACICVFAGPAYAYLDPGTGSMVVQAVIAALAAAGVAFSVFRRKLRSFVTRIFRKGKNPNREELD